MSAHFLFTRTCGWTGSLCFFKLSSIQGFVFEPAGHSIHSAALKLLGYDQEAEIGEEEQTKSKDKGQSYMPSSDSCSTKCKKKSGDKEQQDHYALLGLSHLRYLATGEQIRKSYHEVALKYHPDKQAAILLAEGTEAAKQAKKDEIESHFKSIQEAYESLIDPVKRRIYDSTDEFDDEIPTDCAPQDFYKVFSPAFMRNGRWSVNQPLPSLGDDKTPVKEVDSFYDFWYSFRSWREFPHTDEFDLEQAESRDHKRWMERQNANCQRGLERRNTHVPCSLTMLIKETQECSKERKKRRLRSRERRRLSFWLRSCRRKEAARAAENERRRKDVQQKLLHNRRKQRRRRRSF